MNRPAAVPWIAPCTAEALSPRRGSNGAVTATMASPMSPKTNTTSHNNLACDSSVAPPLVISHLRSKSLPTILVTRIGAGDRTIFELLSHPQRPILTPSWGSFERGVSRRRGSLSSRWHSNSEHHVPQQPNGRPRERTTHLTYAKPPMPGTHDSQS